MVYTCEQGLPSARNPDLCLLKQRAGRSEAGSNAGGHDLAKSFQRDGLPRSFVVVSDLKPPDRF
jgi:hypothetical protein